MKIASHATQSRSGETATLDQVSASGWPTVSAGAGGSMTLTSVATAQLACAAPPTAYTCTVTV